ncbi:MarR family winged helix-turn-helix transcriptional regulator [Natronospora cellulosivora (SeqCode)]
MNNKKNHTELRELIRSFERKLGLLDEEMSCCGITLAQCQALVEIGRAKSISLKQLAELLNLEKSTVSRTVNSLVENGYVERRTDPEDRRYIKISLSKDGEKLFTTIESDMDRYFEIIFNSLPENKKDQVLESLELLLKAVDQIDCC